MADQRRFDTLEQTTARTAQKLADDTSTIYGRLATHTHPENAPVVHSHPGAYSLFVPAANQTISHATTTALAFATMQLSSPEVSRSAVGAGHQFALGGSGIWVVHAFCRINAGGSVAYTGLNVATSAYAHATTSAAETTNGITVLSQTVLIFASSGDTVAASVYHERGSDMTVVASATGIRIARVAVT